LFLNFLNIYNININLKIRGERMAVTQDNAVLFRISSSLKGLAFQSIMNYAIQKNIKPENFSEYLRRLILEDCKKNKDDLKAKFNNLKGIENE
jgi:hypothetical protein